MSAATHQGIAEQFEALHRQHFHELAGWLKRRLPLTLVSQSEDFAQEAFIVLWEHMNKGRPVNKAFGLLMTMAQRKVWTHQALFAQQHSFVTDLNDPASVALDGLNEHRYAAGDPALAMVAEELETAHERMTEASDLWRQLHKKVASMKPRGLPTKDPARITQNERRLADARTQRDDALAELQEACRVVGQLRGELERVGGGSWRSCSGWPPARYSGGVRVDGVASDPTSKQCSKGHPLDDLERVSFLADGTRVCRDCRIGANNRQRKATTA
ncbi:RNA polymerase sigma factor [Streptomyces lincolnensis]|uniref:RNA polymerase sigma factor n=1 Tax=Streptomyces lincolnensis TaxID=1915 RepID=UPI0037D186C2